jgi:basic membrane protein A and related proteins
MRSLNLKRTYRLPTVVALLALVVVSAASANRTSSSATFSVGFVTTLSGINDQAVNTGINTGLQKAIAQLGVTGVVTSTGSANDYIPGLTAFGQQGYNLVIAPRMVGELDQSAVAFPKTTFAGVDVSIDEMLDAPANYIGIMFKDQQSGYLAGYLAGLMIDNSSLKKVASAIGGIDSTEEEAYIAGYTAGIHRADKKIKLIVDWADTVTERATCTKIANSQIAKGTSVMFSVAGRCGDSGLKTAGKKHVWGIGFDFDESSVSPQILTSAVKKVDAAVYLTIAAVQAGTLKGGADVTYGVAEGAVGLGKINAKVPAALVKKAADLEKQLAAGKITNIPTTVK